MLKQLDLLLPEGTHLDWVSDRARDVWRSRFCRVIRAWSHIEWLSVAAGVRPCCVTQSSSEAIAAWVGPWSQQGLAVLPAPAESLADHSDPGTAGESAPHGAEILRLMVGSPRDLAALHAALGECQHPEIARLLGCPRCCYDFYRHVWVDQGQEDTTWSMAAATVPGSPTTGQIEVGGPPQANPLWRWLGIRAVPHVPCRFDCRQTVDLADTYLAIGREAGFDKEMDWLLEILSWPVQYTARNGVAEIKTPIGTISVRTDPTPGERVVRRRGEGYPREGTPREEFPDRSPQAPAPRPARIEETILAELLQFHGARLKDLAVADICTGDYCTAVELTDGSQAQAINLFNVHGPHQAPYNYRHYDNLLVRLVQTDPLLNDTFLSQPELDALGQSVRMAILNALSIPLLSPSRLHEHNLEVIDGRLEIGPLLRQGDTVGMIGCMGNYTCNQVGECEFVKRVYFSDFEYEGAYKSAVEERIRQVFYDPKKVEISNGSQNRAICEHADVLILHSSTMSTNTLDDLLDGAQNAREIIVTGWDYAMDPLPLFARGVTGLKTQRVIRPHFVRFLREKLAQHGPGFSTSVKAFLEEFSVRPRRPSGPPSRSIGAMLPASLRSGKAQSAAAPGITRAAARKSAILEETLQHLEANPQLGARRITDLTLGHYFTLIELDDGSVGACASYYQFPLPILSKIQKEMAHYLSEDALLLGWLFQDQGAPISQSGDQVALLKGSLRAAVVSALSAPALRKGGDETFEVFSVSPPDLFAEARRALVIGFGGYMDTLAKAEHVAELHIADLTYPRQRQRMDAVAANYRRQCPAKTITLSDGHDTFQRLRAVDLVSITGSALCNGTMESLLQGAQGGPRIIVQGQSAAIHPKALFVRGVHLVATTIKPPDLLKIHRADPTGKALRRLLEGDLPWIYLVPRKMG